MSLFHINSKHHQTYVLFLDFFQFSIKITRVKEQLINIGQCNLNKLTLSRFPHDEITLIRRSIAFLVNVASKAANMAAEAIKDGL